MEYLTFVINTCNNDNFKNLQFNVIFFVDKAKPFKHLNWSVRVANGGTEPLANCSLKSLKREILRLYLLTSSYYSIICKIRFDVM